LLAEWKEVAITLLPKEGDQGNPSVYRPIALLQVEYKIFTSILTKRLYSAFNNGILSNLQCGFHPGWSMQDCIQALTASCLCCSSFSLTQ
jgi:hypothetical protein